MNAQGRLIRWVACFAGSKNAVKGVGIFLGGLLLQALGFQAALGTMAALLAMVPIALAMRVAMRVLQLDWVVVGDLGPFGFVDEKSAVAALAALSQGMRLRVFRTLVGAGPRGLTYRPVIGHMQALLDCLSAHCCQGETCR